MLRTKRKKKKFGNLRECSRENGMKVSGNFAANLEQKKNNEKLSIFKT